MGDEHSSIDRLLNVDVPYAPADEDEAQYRMATQLEVLRAARAEDSEDVPPGESSAAPSPNTSDALWKRGSSSSGPLDETPRAALADPLIEDEPEQDVSEETSVSRAQAQAYIEMLKAHRITVTSGDRKVRVTVNGNGALLEIQVDPSAARQVRLTELERAVVSAVNEARVRANAFRERGREALLAGRAS